jgi:hypothetical protein
MNWSVCVKRREKSACCAEDEGRSFGVVLKEKTPNSHELLQSKAVGAERRGKGVTWIMSCVGWGDERKRTADDASKVQARHRTRAADYSGNSTEGTCLLAIRCPVLRQRESNPGFCTELENLAGAGKGKGASGRNREARK